MRNKNFEENDWNGSVPICFRTGPLKWTIQLSQTRKCNRLEMNRGANSSDLCKVKVCRTNFCTGEYSRLESTGMWNSKLIIVIFQFVSKFATLTERNSDRTKIFAFKKLDGLRKTKKWKNKFVGVSVRRLNLNSGPGCMGKERIFARFT